MDGNGDSARRALVLFNDRWRLVAKKAHRRAWLRDLNRTDREDLVQECLAAFWADCIARAGRGGDANSIATRFSVSRGWRRFCQFKWPKTDAMRTAKLETDIEAERRQRVAENVGSSDHADEDPSQNSPLDELAVKVDYLNFEHWRERFANMPDSERWWLTFLHDKGLSTTQAAARIGITRQSLEAHLRRDPSYGNKLGGRVFHRQTGREHWLFPPNVESFLETRAACSETSGVLKSRDRAGEPVESFSSVHKSSVVQHGGPHGQRAKDPATNCA